VSTPKIGRRPCDRFWHGTGERLHDRDEGGRPAVERRGLLTPERTNASDLDGEPRSLPSCVLKMSP
jgi:hypothetical protein